MEFSEAIASSPSSGGDIYDTTHHLHTYPYDVRVDDHAFDTAAHKRWI